MAISKVKIKLKMMFTMLFNYYYFTLLGSSANVCSLGNHALTDKYCGFYLGSYNAIANLLNTAVCGMNCFVLLYYVVVWSVL